MRQVVWTDDGDYLRVSLVRDDDPDEMAPHGIPKNPPDLEQLDWEGIKREINNKFVEEGLLTWRDVQQSPLGIGPILLGVLKTRIVDLYKLKEVD